MKQGRTLWARLLGRDELTSLHVSCEDLIWKVSGKPSPALRLGGDWPPSCWGFALSQWLGGAEPEAGAVGSSANRPAGRLGSQYHGNSTLSRGSFVLLMSNYYAIRES